MTSTKTNGETALSRKTGSDLLDAIRHPEVGDTITCGASALYMRDPCGIDNRETGGQVHHAVRIRYEDGTLRRAYPSRNAYEAAAKEMIDDGGTFYRPNAEISNERHE